MTHSIHRPGYEELAVLDPQCDDCKEKTLARLDDKHFYSLLGMTRAQFDVLTDPSAAASGALRLAAVTFDQLHLHELARYVRRAQAVLWAGRYELRRAVALKIAAEVDELQNMGKWPLRYGVSPFSSRAVAEAAGLLPEPPQEARNGGQGNDASGEAE